MRFCVLVCVVEVDELLLVLVVLFFVFGGGLFEGVVVKRLVVW